ncbi:hypothetical protein [Nonomuraea lactucae]|uniref:hypothetical protein n=1 Tax=Nonomuraea lactucae TaxID=2249762 RepID=UPI001966B6EC|nr:hypothetical protein [Nonomuraea lactucae]
MNELKAPGRSFEHPEPGGWRDEKDAYFPSDVMHLEQVRAWFGRPLWEMEPANADVHFGKVLRSTAKGTRLSRAQALKTFFLFLELRHKVEIHQMTGRVVECPIDEMNRPRGRQQASQHPAAAGGTGRAGVGRPARRRRPPGPVPAVLDPRELLQPV